MEEEIDDEADEDEDDEETKALSAELAEYRRRNSSFDYVHVGCSLDKIVDHINVNAGVESFKVSRAFMFQYPCILSERTNYSLLSFRTNYDDGPLPTVDDIMKLHQYLGVEYP